MSPVDDAADALAELSAEQRAELAQVAAEELAEQAEQAAVEGDDLPLLTDTQREQALAELHREPDDDQPVWNRP